MDTLEEVPLCFLLILEYGRLEQFGRVGAMP